MGIIGVAAMIGLPRRLARAPREGDVALGRDADAIADRFFVLTVVATMLFTGRIGTGGYFVMILRDIATAVGFIVARASPGCAG